MPFHAVDEQGNLLEARPRVSLLYAGANLWQLQTPFCYREGNQRYDVPAHDTARPADAAAGNATDLASVPWLLWNLIASFGRQTLPALLHDRRCWQAHQNKDAAAALAERRHADDQFYRALREEGMHGFRAYAMWTAVSLAAYQSHAGRQFAMILTRILMPALFGVAAAACGLLAWADWWAPPTPRAPAWLALAAAVLWVAAARAGREQRLVFGGVPLALLFVPAALAQLLVVVLVWGTGTVFTVVEQGRRVATGDFRWPNDWPSLNPYLIRMIQLFRGPRGGE